MKFLDLFKSKPQPQPVQLPQPKAKPSLKIQLTIDENRAMTWNDANQYINQNIAITGGMGAGKTQLVKSWALDMNKVTKRIIIDYKADYTDSDFLNKMNGKAYDLKKEPLPFNPMLPNSFDLVPNRDIKYRLATIVQSYSKSMGGKQLGFLREAIDDYLQIKEAQKGIKANLLDGSHVARFKKVALAFIGNKLKENEFIPYVEKFLTENKANRGYFDEYPNFTEFLKYSSDNDLLDGAFVAESLQPLSEFNVFPSSNITFEDFMKNGETSVIVVKSMYSNAMKNLVSHVIIEHLYPYMLANRKGELEEGHIREIQTLLLIDEAKTIMSEKVESLISLLKEGREFGFAVMFGTQYQDDFDQQKGYKYLKYFPTRFNGKNNDERHKLLKPHHFEVNNTDVFVTPYWQR